MFTELITAYLDHMRSLRRSLSTLRNYRRTTEAFAEHCQRVHQCANPNEVRERYLGTFVHEMKQRGLKETTIYSRQRIVRTWFAWAYLRQHLLLDPLKDLHSRHPSVMPKQVPTEEQVARFLAVPQSCEWGRRDQCLLEFLYCTGLRVGECANLDVPDLDLQLCQVKVRATKTRRERIVPFGERVRTIMNDYLENIRPLFEPAPGHEQTLWLSLRGYRCKIHTIEMMMRRTSLEAGVSITPHTLRHAYATHLLQRGANIVAVSSLLGHVRLGSTQRYTHLVPKDLQKELFATHPRGVRKKKRKKHS